jgi:tape measure domain-containing protein
MAQTLSGLIQVKITGDAKELLRVLQTVKRELAGIGAEVKKKPLSEGFLKLKQTLNTVNNVASKVTNTLLGMRSILGMIAVGVVGKSILDTALTFNKWNASLEALTGSATESLRVQEMLKQQAKELGQRYVVLIEQYTKFRGAAEMAGMKLQDVEKIFRSVSKAAVVFQLDAKDTYEIFRALTQMLSKGTISAEELRGQFGERIPGALAIMADSLGVTLSTLLKLMEDGELLADVVLPKMGEGLEKTFGGRVIKLTQTAQAEINRFANVIDYLKNKIAVSGALDKFVETLKHLGDYLSREDVAHSLSEIANGLIILLDGIVKFVTFLSSMPLAREVFGLIMGVTVGSAVGGPTGALIG